MTSIKRNRYGPVTPISVPLEGLVLNGDLQISDDARGLVIFVHGSGSSRFSPRNRYVAQELNKRGLATLLLDLLTDEEQKIDVETMQYRFDIPLLASRSTLVAGWAQRQPEMSRLPIGLFGASTGAAAALITAAAMKERIAAVVSRGGRPDLAGAGLDKVQAPTLLIVGGDDETVLALNRKAMEQMRCITKLHVVPGATHLFEEPGTLEQAAAAAGKWFVECMEKRAAGTTQEAAG
jgi:putative phosphoribosyl transferase